MTPIRCFADDPVITQVYTLIHEAFAYMDGRINPPSSVHRLTESDVRAQCQNGEVWALGEPVQACVLLSIKPDCLYVGKLAVAAEQRGQGLARQLIDTAARRAKVLGLPCLELETRVELTENHTAFAKLGFVKTGEQAHEGYDRPTSITMRKLV